ncbi:MAG TPA: gephyrin-like molybdotransferase Glp [Thermodesulfobacteriota bacterium]|nr:gephyrin-like molybdotransferase Glp [Thermodesulfobacteriota bacterium]
MMKGFFKVQTPDELYKKLGRFKPLSSEKVSLEGSLQRVLAEDMISAVNLPEFPRSTVDGFALKAKDTYGTSEKNPGLVRVIGEISMGQVSEIEIKDGEAIKVATGGMVPGGADAVEMVEYTEWVDSNTLHIFKTLSPLENVVQKGEDINAGDLLLHTGHKIRPQDIGLLAGVGKTEVMVFRKPRVGIISSGDEIIPIERTPNPGEIRDINRHSITSMVSEIGGMPIFLGIAKDRFDALKEKLDRGFRESDMVIVTGGSSVGALDLTLDVLQSFAGTELIAHGVSVRPGKPTLIADVDGKPFLGLPGHPVSAMVIFHLFGRTILRTLSGHSREEAPYRNRLKAKAARNIPSIAGREDYVRVKLEEREGTLWAHPLFGKSGAIAHLTHADGLLKIGINEEGLGEGEEAEVILL